MIFESGKGEKRNKEWKWNEEGIEEVKEMKYLGFIMEKMEEQRNIYWKD